MAGAPVGESLGGGLSVSRWCGRWSIRKVDRSRHRSCPTRGSGVAVAAGCSLRFCVLFVFVVLVWWSVTRSLWRRQRASHFLEASLREKPFLGLGAAVAGAAMMAGTGRPISSSPPLVSIIISLVGVGVGTATTGAGVVAVGPVGATGAVGPAAESGAGVSRPGRSVDEAGGEEEAEAADSVAVAGCSGENGESGRGVSPVCVLVGVELGGVKMSDAEGEGAGKGEEKESAAGAAVGAGEEGTAAAAAGGACSASVVVPSALARLLAGSPMG